MTDVLYSKVILLYFRSREIRKDEGVGQTSQTADVGPGSPAALLFALIPPTYSAREKNACRPQRDRKKCTARREGRTCRANVPEQTCLPKAVSQRDPFEEEGSQSGRWSIRSSEQKNTPPPHTSHMPIPSCSLHSGGNHRGADWNLEGGN